MHSEIALDVLQDEHHLAHLELVVGNEWGNKYVTYMRTQLSWGSLLSQLAKSVGNLNLSFLL